MAPGDTTLTPTRELNVFGTARTPDLKRDAPSGTSSSSGDFVAEMTVAQMLEDAERHHDCIAWLRPISTRESAPLEAIKRLTRAYRQLMWQCQCALHALDRSSQGNEPQHYALMRQRYRSKIRRELCLLIEEVMRTIDSLLDCHHAPGHRVELYREKGDCYRKLCGLYTDADRLHHTDLSREAFECAEAISISALHPTSPIRLNVALSYATLLHDVVEDARAACLMVRRAHDDAISVLDEIDEQTYKDTTVMLQLLYGCLQPWGCDIRDGNEEPPHQTLRSLKLR